MNNYVKTQGALGAIEWQQGGMCVDTSTNKAVNRDKCAGTYSEWLNAKRKMEARGGGAVWDFFRQTFLPQQGPGYGGPGGAPTTTASSLLLPAVAVVGVVGVLLILKKKK
jgi:hypothetical protein